MEGTEVVIQGKHYSFKNLAELPENLSLDKVSSRQDATHYGFFGQFNPLSNFHPAVFTYNGESYNHTEQFIQARKAEFCNDYDSFHMIMATSSAVKCKELGRSVKNFNTKEWNSKAKELCFLGILCKFQQNPDLAAFLKSTANKVLLECCYDNVWGNGFPLYLDQLHLMWKHFYVETVQIRACVMKHLTINMIIVNRTVLLGNIP